ncbi:uncharacterized protein LOC142225478 [Haematobia irritans]|uniref:uncharacterized protein LOC142225478 n=1 Tax=Haematobia irritans TaxID=7368 RepID=UPI003F4F4914
MSNIEDGWKKQIKTKVEIKMFKRKTTSHNEIFIDFMEENKDLAMGFTKRDKVVQDKLWSDLADKLNACGPHRRGVSEWRKTWTDWKRNIKTNVSVLVHTCTSYVWCHT